MNLKKYELTKLQLFSLTLSSQYFDTDLKYHYKLSGSNSRLLYKSRRSVKRILENKWDIHNSNDVKKTLNWFLNEGIRTHFDSIRYALSNLSDSERENYVKIHIKSPKDWCEEATVNYYLNRLTPAGIAAYDYGCYSYLCRSSYTAGFITKHEALELLELLPTTAQKSYSSWVEYLTAFYIGFEFAIKSKPYETTKHHTHFINKLLVSNKSTFNTIDWNIDFNQE